MQLLVLGATGRIGRIIAGEAIMRGHGVTAQSRAARLVPPGAKPLVGDPDDAALLAGALPGHDAVICALGVDQVQPSTLPSDTTRALLAQMATADVSRLVAITGAGTGETHGQGRWLRRRILAPLFARQRHPDKDMQEALITGSNLDWTIIRPGPIVEGPLKGGLHALWPVPPDVQVAAVTSTEVAEFVLDVVEQSRWRHCKPLIGHFA